MPANCSANPIAFTFVNITVIVYFAYRQKLTRGADQIVRNIVLPLLGVAATLVLWANLSPESRNYGLIWFAVGTVVLLGMTRFLRRPLTLRLEE